MKKPEKHVFVCCQNRPSGHPRGSCVQLGSNELLKEFWKELQNRNLNGSVSVTYSGCIDSCSDGPNVLVYPDGILYVHVGITDIPEIIDQHLIGNKPVERLLAPKEIWN